jgi:hypothetical protein
MRSKSLFIIMTILVLINANSPSKALANGNGKKDVCVPPLFNIAFPVVPSSQAGNVTQRKIPPQGNWQIQDTLPFSQDKLGYIYAIPKQNKLLFTGQFNEIFIYFIDSKQWKSIQQPVDWMLGRLFVANDGTIWGPVASFTNTANSKKSYSLLSRYNKATNRFEFIDDKSGFLHAPQVRLISNIAEDQSGLLWFFVGADKNTLVSFDTKTGKSKKHYDFKIAGGNTNVVIGPEGSVWFRDFYNKEIVQYIPSTQETHTYKIASAVADEMTSIRLLNEFDKANYIFMDQQERLWLANFAWLDFSNNNSPEWHQVVESPVFLTDRGLPESQYMMAYQLSTYQSSNGWYWFTGGNGIVRLDLQEGMWCLMTTGVSNVVEDDKQNLWIAVFGYIYKYPLKH